VPNDTSLGFSRWIRIAVPFQKKVRQQNIFQQKSTATVGGRDLLVYGK
jgi:hypothetical protein